MIETQRLLLRQWKPSDLAPFAKINACERVCEFLLKPLTPEESDAFAASIVQHFEQHGYGLYAVELKSTGQFIGFTGFNIPPFSASFMPAVEIGWRLDHAFWGQGYATEAAKAALEHGKALGLSNIVSFTVPANKRSQRVMKKIGLTYNSEDDFEHPMVSKGNPLQHHVLYRFHH